MHFSVKAIIMSANGVAPPFRGAAIPKGSPFSAISSSDNLRLGIRLELGLGSVVWLWQYQELFRATTMNDGFQNGGPFGMEDRNPAKWTEILFSFDVCLCVRGQSDQFKTVKATDFKFVMHVPRDSPDMPPLKIIRKGVSVKIHLAEICTLASAF